MILACYSSVSIIFFKFFMGFTGFIFLVRKVCILWHNIYLILLCTINVGCTICNHKAYYICRGQKVEESKSCQEICPHKKINFGKEGWTLQIFFNLDNGNISCGRNYSSTNNCLEQSINRTKNWPKNMNIPKTLM